MALMIIRPGMFTTVQDCGRWGFQAQGVGVSGAMDVFSHRLANALVGNTNEAATLEVTLLGPEIEFQVDSTIAVAGAEFRLTLDGGFVQMHQALDVSAGSRLKFGERTKGARAYLAVAGGIDVPAVLGSRATHVVTAMGGFDGRALRAGDIVKKQTGVVLTKRAKKTKQHYRPLLLPEGGAKLRVIAGPKSAGFLTTHRYTILPQSNRVGYRLEGPAVFERPTGEMISTAVPTGAVQVPPTGQPILLMADHAPTGGYAIAATVVTADLPLAGQLAPGDWVEFQACTLEDADTALRDREAALDPR
jgi:antagonist of KipI